MKISDWQHLAYCTNVHPAESWAATKEVLGSEVLSVRDALIREGRGTSPFAIGLRLSAQAARELLAGDELKKFQAWLEETETYVFTINGFPYGDFHGTRVKEKVYQPDWTTSERLVYTKDLFDIVATLAPEEAGGSVSTLPGSYKDFKADESLIFKNLEECALHIEKLAQQTGKDLHLGLEPEPLGHFENTAESLAFFERFFASVADEEMVRRRVGLNFDCCHFAIEFDDCREALDAFEAAGIRISKVHLSSAVEFDISDEAAMEKLREFDEPTYLHQVITSGGETRYRFGDLPDFFAAIGRQEVRDTAGEVARCHFHVPLYAEAAPPLRTTQFFVNDLMAYCDEKPGFCPHFEIETYTWGVLPESLQTGLTNMIVKEFEWVLAR
ncbi:MAG: metabolite traffic protein EboE [Verrucomicrobiota bacterium JB023]|nr:metabolite traffic protein EboE [Verrucomicrobiota bacterium JB023]